MSGSGSESGAGNRLFRLIVMLKAMTWIALLSVLGVSLYRAAMGADNPLPVTALTVIGALAVLQVAAMVAWRLVRKES